MRRLILFLVFCITGLWPYFATAQNDDMSFALVVAPPVAPGLNDMQMQKLESRLIQIIHRSGEALEDNYSDFALYSSVTVDKSGRVEGGLQQLYVVTAELSLFVKQISTGVIFNSLSVKIKGSGNNDEEALTEAIDNINASDSRYTRLIANTKEKILKYYAANCNDIVQKADDCAKRHDYEQAFSMLQAIPASCSCYDKAHKMCVEYYLRYQSVACSRNLELARSQIAVRNYDAALQALNDIDPESKCWGDAKKLTDEISAKVKKNEKREYNLEVMRINAIRSLAKDYYTSKVKGKK